MQMSSQVLGNGVVVAVLIIGFLVLGVGAPTVMAQPANEPVVPSESAEPSPTPVDSEATAEMPADGETVPMPAEDETDATPAAEERVNSLAMPTEEQALEPVNTTTDDTMAPMSDDPERRVLVTASRRAEDEASVARSADQVDGDEVTHRLGAFNVPEALREEPGVNVQNTGRWMGSPYIRGLTGYHNLILIDGVRFNNSIFRSGPNQYLGLIDQFLIDRMELVYGPGSVQYGSDAVGGTIQLFSPRWDRDADDLYGRVFAQYDTTEQSSMGHIGLGSALDDSSGFVLGLSAKHFGDRIAGSGELPYTGYDQYDGNFRYTRYIGSHWEVDVLSQFTFLDDAPRTHRTIHAVPFEGTSVGSDVKREFDHWRVLNAVQIRTTDGTAIYDTMLLTISHQYLYEDRYRVFDDDRFRHEGLSVHTVGLAAQLEAIWDNLSIVYGTDAYLDRVRSWGERYNADGSVDSIRLQGPVGDDAWYGTVGTFAEATIQLSQNWRLQLGARQTVVVADIDQVSDPETGDPISLYENFFGSVGHVGLSYQLCPAWLVYGDYSEGFRAPNLSDLSRLDTARTNEIETAAPGLDPEYFHTLELGIRGQTDRWTASAAVYGTLIDGMIIRTPTGVVIGTDFEVTKQNAGSCWIAGVEGRLDWEVFSPISVFGFLSWMNGETDYYPTSDPADATRTPLTRLIPLSGELGARYVFDASPTSEPMTWAEFFVRFNGEQSRLSISDQNDTSRIPAGGTPGWVTLNLRGNWQPMPGLTIIAQLLNLTDEDYRRHGSGLNEPGFQAILGADWRW